MSDQQEILVDFSVDSSFLPLGMKMIYINNNNILKKESFSPKLLTF